MVREDQIGIELAQGAREIGSGVDAACGAAHAGAAQLVLHELGVLRHVLDEEDAVSVRR